MLLSSMAFAAVTIQEGRGIARTRLGQDGDYIASKLSGVRRKVKDTRYSYVVWHWYVGKKMSNGRYPVELYAKRDEKVFRYQVNSAAFVTSKGVKVGVTEKYMRSRYSNEKGPYTSGRYRRYTIRHKIFSFYTYTDFYCRSGRVNYIIIRR